MPHGNHHKETWTHIEFPANRKPGEFTIVISWNYQGPLELNFKRSNGATFATGEDESIEDSHGNLRGFINYTIESEG